MAQYNQRDVDAVQQKLQAFSSGLPQQEKNVLDWVLSRASDELADGDLEDVAGGGDVEQVDDSVSVSVGWSKS
jgi:hypothetical protein